MSDIISKYAGLWKTDLSEVNDRQMLMKALYQNKALKRRVRQYVRRNGGNARDGHDVLADAIVGFVMAFVKGRKEVIEEEPDAYFFGVVRNVWRNMLRKRRKLGSFDAMKGQQDIEVSQPLSDETRHDIQGLLGELDEKCRKVLTLWSLDYKMREIAIQMSYSSEHMAKKKKYICLKRLTELLNSKPALKRELRDYE